MTLGACALDLALGEAPSCLHPVVAMGAFLTRAERHMPATPAFAALAGAGWWAAGVAATYTVGMLLDRLPAPAQALALSTTISLRTLLSEVAEVEQALDRSLEEGRARVARIVSRPTAGLDAAGVREAAISSLTENLSDAVVAPWFWYAVGGLPAALAYRFVNTADAMWGYRDHRRWLGLVAARADDLANLIPARLTAVALLPRPMKLRMCRREARRTPSPNAGHPMAAGALARGIRLGKAGVYVLNPTGRQPEPDDTVALSRRSLAVGIAAALAAARTRR